MDYTALTAEAFGTSTTDPTYTAVSLKIPFGTSLTNIGEACRAGEAANPRAFLISSPGIVTFPTGSPSAPAVVRKARL